MVSHSKQSYSKQKGGQRRATLSALKKHIKELSNGDEQVLLEDLFKSRFVAKMNLTIDPQGSSTTRTTTTPSKAEQKLQAVCERITERYNASDDLQKRQWATLLVGIMTYDELKKYGMTITRKTFAKARKHVKEFGSEIPTTTVRPKAEIPDEKKEEIINFCLREDISRVAPRGMFKNSKKISKKNNTQVEVPMRCLVVTSIKEAFRRYQAFYGDNAVGETSFRKYFPSYIKKAKAITNRPDGMILSMEEMDSDAENLMSQSSQTLPHAPLPLPIPAPHHVLPMPHPHSHPHLAPPGIPLASLPVPTLPPHPHSHQVHPGHSFT